MDQYESDSEEFELIPRARKSMPTSDEQIEQPTSVKPKPKKPRKPLTAKQLEALKKGQAIRDRNRLIKQKSKLTKIKQKEEEIESILQPKKKPEPDYVAALAQLHYENKKLKKAIKKPNKYDDSSSDEDDIPVVKKKKEKKEKQQEPNKQSVYMDSLDRLLLGLRS